MRRETISLAPGNDGLLPGMGSGGLVVAALNAASAAERGSCGRRGLSAVIVLPPDPFTASLRLDAAFLDDLAPLVHLARHEGAELVRAHAHHVGAFRLEALLRVRRILRRGERRAHPLDDLL